jgi:hypothetical protein
MLVNRPATDGGLIVSAATATMHAGKKLPSGIDDLIHFGVLVICRHFEAIQNIET